MNKEQLLELAWKVGLHRFESHSSLEAFAKALAEPLEKRIKDEASQRLFSGCRVLELEQELITKKIDWRLRGEQIEELKLRIKEQESFIARQHTYIAELESALVIADRDRKNAEIAIDDAKAERTVSPEVVAIYSRATSAFYLNDEHIPAHIKSFGIELLGRIVPTVPMTDDEIDIFV